MRKFLLFCMVYGFTLVVVNGPSGPADSYAGACNNDKLVADLDIKALEGEDAVLETVRQAYRRLANAVEVPLLLLLDDNVVWSIEGVSGVVPFAGTYEGKEGVLRYEDDVRGAVCIESLAARFFVKLGSAIDVHLVEEGLVIPTGKRFTMDIVHVWRLNEDGKITSFREYNDTFAMAAAFDAHADPAMSLAANSADYRVPTSPYVATMQTGLNFYAALGSADIMYFVQNSEPGLVWILAGPPTITPIAGTFYEIKGIIDFFTRVFNTEAYLDFRVKSIVVDGSRMDAEFHEKVYVYATGKTFTCDGLHTAIFGDDGKLRSFRSYNDTYSVASGHSPEGGQ